MWPKKAAAARAQRADSVVLSFSSASKERQTRDSLAPQVEVWAGGRSPVLYKRPPDLPRILDLRQGELRPAH